VPVLDCANGYQEEEQKEDNEIEKACQQKSGAEKKQGAKEVGEKERSSEKGSRED
jgi:hypothetical protein